MMARGFKPVGWVAAVGAAALGCYMLSLRVATERADLAQLDSRIVAARQNIRSLQTEVGTRGRITQLEDWNDEVLALAAPVSGQYVEGHVSLARFETRPPQLADQARVRLASTDTPAPAPRPAAPQATTPMPQHAVATTAVALQAPAQQATVRQASLTVGPPAPAPRAEAAPAKPRAAAGREPVRAAIRQPVRTAAREPVRVTPPPARVRLASADERPASARAARAPAPKSARAAALLTDRTMRELSSAARNERDRGTGN